MVDVVAMATVAETVEAEVVMVAVEVVARVEVMTVAARAVVMLPTASSAERGGEVQTTGEGLRYEKGRGGRRESFTAATFSENFESRPRSEPHLATCH